MFWKPTPLRTGKMEWEEGTAAARRVGNGQSIEQVARRYRRDPAFIRDLIEYRATGLPSFLNPYMNRPRAQEALRDRLKWSRLIATIRYWSWKCHGH